jgi:hypothetical protein
MSPRTRRKTWGLRSWGLWSVAVVALSAGVLSAGPRKADAQITLLNFAAVGNAEGVRYNAVAANAPLTESLVDFGTPVAQSEVDAVNGSQAYAAAPYPGDTVLTGPALAFGALGVGVSAPQYPLYVNSRYPSTPEGRNEDVPGVALRANSDESTSVARAETGGSSDASSVARSVADSTSSLDRSSGKLTVEATSSAEVITVKGLLRIGRVQGRATATLVPGGQVQRNSQIIASDVTVAGQSAQITEQGIVLDGAATALPVGGQVDVLRNAGISAHLVAPRETDDGVVSGALEITIAAQGPTGPTTQYYTFGWAAARVSLRSDTPPSSDAIPSIAASPADTGPTPLPVSSGTPTPASVGHGAESALPASTSVSRPSRVAFPLADTVSFYLAIVLAALVVLGAAQLVRIMGVRTLWTS